MAERETTQWAELADELDDQVEELRATLAAIVSLIGNVDHAKSDGPNSAMMRGQMLNDIRDMASSTLSGES